MKCNECGNRQKKGTVCTNCGATLKEFREGTSKKKTHKGLIIGIIIVVLALALAVGGHFLYKHFNEEESPVVDADADKILGIAIKDYPKKMKYTIGEEPDFTGMSVNIYYADETVETITDGYECDWHPFKQEGKYKIDVKYKEFSTDVIVDVYEDIEKSESATSISIVSLPNKLEYAVGDKPDYTGLKVQAHYSDGTTKIVSGVSCYVHPLDKAGEYAVTVEYLDLECTFNIHVH